MTLRTFSFGGGVQSTAALVLAARGELEVDVFLFANVGEDSENPHTLRYVTEVAIPFAEASGVRLEVVGATVRKESVTLVGELHRRKTSYTIPVHFEAGGMGRRKCTFDFKIRPIAKWLREHGATAADPAIVSLGISTDEMHRMRTSSGFDYYTLAFPLVERRLYRDQCEAIIAEAGLPIPPKSSCYFCPFHSLAQWHALRMNDPALFEQAAEIEDMLTARMQAKQDTSVYLSGKRRPLRQAIPDHIQPGLLEEDEDTCESGYCMT